MIQAIGLTSLPRRHQLKPAVDDLTFEARPGRVTVLLGPEGSGKTTALRLMLQLQSGRGTALFRGRGVHRIPHLAREVGVLLGEVNGHPGRTARGHLRMLAAAAGVPHTRADDVLDVVGLSGLADQRMSTYSRGMDRRLGMACALMGDPHTLVLDEPAHGLSPRETAWLYSLLRGYAKLGGTVLVTSQTSGEAAELGDRIVSIDWGRLVADQHAADFVRTRLRPRVAVRTPHAERLAAVLAVEGRRAGKDRDNGPIKVVREGGTKLSVYGSSCAEVGEYAHRHGILIHQLTDERGPDGDAHTPGPLDRADGRRSSRKDTEPDSQPQMASSESKGARATTGPSSGSRTGPELPELRKLEDLEDIHDAAAEDVSADSFGSTRVSTTDSGSTGVSSGRITLSPANDPQAFAPDAVTATDGEVASPSDSTSEAPSEQESGHSAEPEQEPALDPDPEPEQEPEPVLAATAVSSPTRSVDGSTPSLRPVASNSPAASAASTESDLADPTPQDTALAEDTDAESGPLGTKVESDPLGTGTGPGTGTGSGSAPDRQADSDSDSAPTSSEEPTLRLSDGPLVDPSAVPAASESGETGPPARPILMKPLADPDAPRKPKSPWTPKSPPARAAAELPPQLHAVPRPGPAAPLRYELCRLASVRSTWIAVAATVVVALCVSLVMARTGMGLPSGADNSLAPVVRLLTGWPAGDIYVLPPAAVAAGLLGAFAFGEEFRYPALAPARSPVTRRLSLLSAKLAVSAILAVLLGLMVAAVNAAGVTLFFGSGALSLPSDPTAASDGPWQLHVAAVFAFAVGCAWAGVLAAGIFRSGTVGTAVVVSVPLLLAPVVRTMLSDARYTTDGLPGRLETALLMPWPPGSERWVAALLELVAQPVGFALALTLAALLTGYLVMALNSRSG